MSCATAALIPSSVPVATMVKGASSSGRRTWAPCSSSMLPSTKASQNEAQLIVRDTSTAQEVDQIGPLETRAHGNPAAARRFRARTARRLSAGRSSMLACPGTRRGQVLGKSSAGFAADLGHGLGGKDDGPAQQTGLVVACIHRLRFGPGHDL